MNKHEISTIRQEAQRFTKGITVVEFDLDSVKLELPYINADKEPLYFFVTKRKGMKKFSLLVPVASVGLYASNNTLSLLQPFLKTYGLLLSQDATIMEESTLPLNQRFRNLAQAIIGIDGIRRLWKVENDRRNIAIKSQDIESVSNPADSITSE